VEPLLSHRLHRFTQMGNFGIGFCFDKFYKELIVVYVMKKVVGYVVSVVGLVLMALGFDMFKTGFAILDGVSSNVIVGVGVGAIIVGVVISLRAEGSGSGKARQAKEEVPIYEGTGKKRKIVGYRKD